MGCGWIVSAQEVDGLASEEGGLAENGDYRGLHGFLRCSKLRKVTFLSARLSAFIIPNNPESQCCCYPRLTDEETRLREVNNKGGRAGNQTGWF